jgi:hypothetical protein
MPKKETVTVQGTEIAVLTHRQDDYISLTDMAKHRNPDATGTVISHWLRTGYTLNFSGAWERLHNPDFNVTDFGNIKMESVDNSFILSTKQWVERTNAIGIIAKRDGTAGRMPIVTSRLNLRRGSRRSSSCT